MQRLALLPRSIGRQFTSVSWTFLTQSAFLTLALSASFAAADDSESDAVRQMTIERAPVILRAAETYQVPISLQAVRRLELTAQVDGIVSSIQVELGDATSAQAEAVRLESTQLTLELERAQARLREVTALQSAADAGGDANAMEAAAAAVDVAEADLSLAQFRLSQAIIRFPYDGVVAAIHVTVGQYVRVGEPLMTFADISNLRVEVPIVRNSVQQGDSLPLTIEQTQATGTVDIVLPLADRFGPLRDLVPSIAMAVVTINNSNGNLDAGQTVYSELIPRHPVTEVPTAAIQNGDDGGRKVQVLREGTVRDIPIDLLGQEGDAYVFVSGRFSPTDELILSSSIPLLDGERPVPAAQAATETTTNPRGTGPQRGSDF